MIYAPQIGESLHSYSDRCPRYRDLKAEDARVIDILEAAGVQVRISSARKDVSLVGLMSGVEKPYVTLRKFRTIPSQERKAAKKTRQIVMEITAAHPSARYVVMQPISRCSVDDIGDALEAVSKAVERWRKNLLVPAGGRLLWVGLEWTYDPADRSIHAHANLIVLPPLRGFKAIKARSEARYGERLWHDSGQIRNARKVAQYVTKPLPLEKADAGAVLAMHGAITGRQLYRRGAQASGISVEPQQEPTPTGANNGTHAVGHIPGNTARNGSALGVQARGKPSRRMSTRKPQSPEQPVVIENRIIANMGVRFLSDRAEPVLLVQGYTSEPRTAVGRQGLAAIEALRRQYVALWLAAGEPLLSPSSQSSAQNPAGLFVQAPANRNLDRPQGFGLASELLLVDS